MFDGLLTAAMHSKPIYLCVSCCLHGVTVVARIPWVVMAPGDIRLRQWCSSYVCSITSRIVVFLLAPGRTESTSSSARDTPLVTTSLHSSTVSNLHVGRNMEEISRDQPKCKMMVGVCAGLTESAGLSTTYWMVSPVSWWPTLVPDAATGHYSNRLTEWGFEESGDIPFDEGTVAARHVLCGDMLQHSNERVEKV